MRCTWGFSVVFLQLHVNLKLSQNKNFNNKNILREIIKMSIVKSLAKWTLGHVYAAR